MSAESISFPSDSILPRDSYSRALRTSAVVLAAVVAVSLAATLLLRRGFALTCIVDLLQLCLVGAASIFSFRNAIHSKFRLRTFWIFICAGCSIWLLSFILWSVYEIYFRSPAPDLPVEELLLLVKVVPLIAAIVLEPQRPSHAKFRSFGLLDVVILTVYTLYLYSFFVLSWRLIPGATAVYNHQFNLADAIGNHALLMASGVAIFRSEGKWRALYRIYFASVAAYCIASTFLNVAIDLGTYYSGSIYDLPFTASLAGLVAFTIVGAYVPSPEGHNLTSSPQDRAVNPPSALLSSHLAMVVTLSAPAVGLWLLAGSGNAPELFTVRLNLTLLTIFLLTLLLSLKQDLLTASLLQSLRELSATYTRIERFETHLVQSEKLTALGSLVANSANQIKNAMVSIRDLSKTISIKPAADPRIPGMAGKISQYALRTDNLVENMLRFAQETPIQLSPTDLKLLLDSAIQLSRIAKVPNLQVIFRSEENCPLVLGDSSQLLHVFLQIFANASDALENTGGTFEISLSAVGSQLVMQFADSGPGLQDPQRIFEPFYTTKPVGKGTGLGLSTCYGIIQQHDGEIVCRNRPEGGALFTILLPAMTQDRTLEPRNDTQVVEGVR